MKKTTKIILGLSVAAVTSLSASQGENLYNKCQGCHGVNGERAALGKSQIISTWDEKKITDALKGYKAGTYGKAMKGIMKGQVANLDDTQIEQIAKYIVSINR
ncbi:MAG: c-type cytochrome [Campylobacterota bacterium]|nr:c-type cytochrome [Campylobacterota bacterium]